MSKTFETQPQMIVNVEGLPAVCHNRTCDFTYTENVGELLSFTYTAETQFVTMTGTDLPISIANELEKCSGNSCTGYRGYQTKTVSGKTCQAWESQSPQEHTRTP